MLDYGCGAGDLMRVLAELGARADFTGCDVSSGMLAEVGKRWPSAIGPTPALATQDGALTPFADRQFDVVTISAVLHHVPVEERQAVYRELGRVLKPGGRIYVFEHNPRNPLVRYVIARTPIDENAILLDAREVRYGLLDTARYELETDYLMFMPPGIAFLRTHRPDAGVAAPGGAICRGGAQRRLKERTGWTRQTFEAELKRDGYDIQTNTTPGVKVNPEHSHPFDVRAMVVQGALTLTRDGASRTYRAGETFTMPKGCLHSESYGPEGAVTLFGRKM